MPDINYVFRFRDLVAPTIAEHKKIISSRGSCWWGWWKRPSEDSRMDAWARLEKEASLASPIPIALFDSGSGRVFKALVVAVVAPTEGAENTIKAPHGDEELVPQYYRDSPFSRAWMKLTEIEELPEFFGKFSFAEAPNLPRYTKQTLKRLQGKKIMDPDELRLMDTTIWLVRPATPSDPEERILLSVPALSTAVSQEVCRCNANTILHLTDMHFAKDKNRKQHVWRLESESGSTQHSMVEAIKASLGDRKIGLVIASGDFTFVGSKTEFDEAAASLSLLLGTLDLDADRLIIIPGNHDIQWATDEVYNHKSEITQAPAEARRNYEAFYERMMRHEPNRHLAMGRRYVLPCGLVLEICALNSSSLISGKNFLAGMGRIDEGSFADVATELGWHSSRSVAFKMLVIHHHLALTENLELPAEFNRGYGLAVDAVRVQRLAATKGVHVALHGHKHRSFIWRSTVYELPEDARLQHRLGELSIIGGGSVGSSDTHGPANYFNLMTFCPTEMDLEVFQSQSGSFGSISRWHAGLLLDPERGNLVLSDWKAVTREPAR